MGVQFGTGRPRPATDIKVYAVPAGQQRKVCLVGDLVNVKIHWTALPPKGRSRPCFGPGCGWCETTGNTKFTRWVHYVPAMLAEVRSLRLDDFTSDEHQEITTVLMKNHIDPTDQAARIAEGTAWRERSGWKRGEVWRKVALELTAATARDWLPDGDLRGVVLLIDRKVPPGKPPRVTPLNEQFPGDLPEFEVWPGLAQVWDLDEADLPNAKRAPAADQADEPPIIKFPPRKIG